MLVLPVFPAASRTSAFNVCAPCDPAGVPGNRNRPPGAARVRGADLLTVGEEREDVADPVVPSAQMVTQTVPLTVAPF